MIPTRPIPEPSTLDADEPHTLGEYLEYYRAELLNRAAGLSSADLSTTTAASNLTLGGLLKHMALVEDCWFEHRFAGRPEPEPWASAPEDDPDWDFNSAADDSPAALAALFDASCERSRRVVAEVASLDELSVRTNQQGQHWSLRWILVHMVEEYARHCGHADFLRESIDGTTG